ncbi:MAG: hypothetical protein HYX94_10945 [Chloroflexi bacterium]|nr:hypothetical protein [Chloroflexota bacterium]
MFKDLTSAVYYSNSSQRLQPWVRLVQASYDVNALRTRFSAEGVGRTIDGGSPTPSICPPRRRRR